MPPIMANSKDSQGHKDKHIDASRKISSQKMFICNMKALILAIRSNDQYQFFFQNIQTPRSRSHGQN